MSFLDWSLFVCFGFGLAGFLFGWETVFDMLLAALLPWVSRGEMDLPAIPPFAIFIPGIIHDTQYLCLVSMTFNISASMVTIIDNIYV